MNNLLRLIFIGGLSACAVLLIALSMAGNTGALLAPAHLLLFVLAAVVYLLPTGLAVYRECRATIWIGLVNVFLGWTVIGWFASLGWAASGKARFPAQPITSPPGTALHLR